MAAKEVSLNGRDTLPRKSPLLKKTASLVLPKDEHVKKKRKISVEGEAKPQLIVENHVGKVRRLSSTEESWNITSVSSPSRSPSPTKTPNSLKTTLKKIKKEGLNSFDVINSLTRKVIPRKTVYILKSSFAVVKRSACLRFFQPVITYQLFGLQFSLPQLR